jgi:hypothetical protein
MIFFYFLKIIFEISTSKRFENIKKIFFFKKKKKNFKEDLLGPQLIYKHNGGFIGPSVNI